MDTQETKLRNRDKGGGEMKNQIHNLLLTDKRCWTKDDEGNDVISFEGQANVMYEFIENLLKDKFDDNYNCLTCGKNIYLCECEEDK